MKKSDFTDLRNYVFGGTAAIITNVSLIVGLGSAGTNKGPILGGLLTLALADNISDSLGIHMYKEAEGGGARLSWQATALNFLARLLVSSSFISIVLLFSVARAIPIAIGWGLLLVVVMSYWVTIGGRPGRGLIAEIVKHLAVAVAVIAASRFVGMLIAAHFPQT